MWIIKKLAHISLILIVLTWAYQHFNHPYAYAKYFMYIVDQLQFNLLNLKLYQFTQVQGAFFSKLLAIEQGFIVFLVIFNKKNAYFLLLINLIVFTLFIYGEDIIKFRIGYWTNQQKTQFFNLVAISGISLIFYGDKSTKKVNLQIK